MLTGYLLSLLVAAASVQAQQAGVLAGGFTDNITVSATNLVQCAQAAISWTGGRAPYTLTIGTGGYYIGVDTLETHGSIDSNSYDDYTVTQKEGTDMFFMIEEAGGGRGYIQNLPVQAGDGGCLGEASSSASSASSSPSSSSAAARPASSSSSSSSASSASSSSSSSSTTTTSSSIPAALLSSGSSASTSTESAGVVIVTEAASTSTASSASAPSATSVSASASASAPTTLSAAGTSTIIVSAPSLRSTSTNAAVSAATVAAASTVPNSGAISTRSSVVSLACGLAAFLVL